MLLLGGLFVMLGLGSPVARGDIVAAFGGVYRGDGSATTQITGSQPDPFDLGDDWLFIGALVDPSPFESTFTVRGGSDVSTNGFVRVGNEYDGFLEVRGGGSTLTFGADGAFARLTLGRGGGSTGDLFISNGAEVSSPTASTRPRRPTGW